MDRWRERIDPVERVLARMPHRRLAEHVAHLADDADFGHLRSPGKGLVVIGHEAARMVASGALDDAAHAGDAVLDLDARAGLGLGPAGMEGEHADLMARKVDGETAHHGVEPG